MINSNDSILLKGKCFLLMMDNEPIDNIKPFADLLNINEIYYLCVKTSYKYYDNLLSSYIDNSNKKEILQYIISLSQNSSKLLKEYENKFGIDNFYKIYHFNRGE